MLKRIEIVKVRKLVNALILITLSFSAFVHLWNPVGTPDIHGDEGHYIRRAVNVMLGESAQEAKVPEPNPTYGNPFFGQVFLASMLSLLNYPHLLILDERTSINSVASLFLAPRVIMGVLAIVDTFLIFKIAERRYNIKVAFVASILFAVMPFSLDTRRVFLEGLQLPFILLSVLFAVTHQRSALSNNSVACRDLNGTTAISILISGIFLGLAIFTKTTAFNVIPVVAFLIYSNSKNKPLKSLGLWSIPVILIPCMWPAYAILAGDFDEWIEGLSYQTSREGVGILSIKSLFTVDPILLVLGIAGSIFAVATRRDLLCFLWIIPFLIFFSVAGLVRPHNYIPLLPAFCLSGAILATEIYMVLDKYKSSIQLVYIQYFTIGAIVVFGLVITASQLSLNLNSTYFEFYSFLVGKLPAYIEHSNVASDTSKVTIIGNNWVISSFSWIPNFIYNNDHEFMSVTTDSKIVTDKVLFVVDKRMRELMSNDTEIGKKFAQRHSQIRSLFDNVSTIAEFNFTSRGIIEMKTNY